MKIKVLFYICFQLDIITTENVEYTELRSFRFLGKTYDSQAKRCNLLHMIKKKIHLKVQAANFSLGEREKDLGGLRSTVAKTRQAIRDILVT